MASMQPMSQNAGRHSQPPTLPFTLPVLVPDVAAGKARKSSRSRSRSWERFTSKVRAVPLFTEKKKLYVTNLHAKTTSDDIQREFGRYGHVRDVTMPVNKATGAHRGFVFVSFMTSREADYALEKMDGKRLNGRMLTCKKAKARTRPDNQEDEASPPKKKEADIEIDDPCRDYSRWGTCLRGKQCRFKHIEGNKVPQNNEKWNNKNNKNKSAFKPRSFKPPAFKPAHDFKRLPRPKSRSPSPRYHKDGHEFATIKGKRYPFRSQSRSSSSEWLLVPVVNTTCNPPKEKRKKKRKVKKEKKKRKVKREKREKKEKKKKKKDREKVKVKEEKQMEG